MSLWASWCHVTFAPFAHSVKLSSRALDHDLLRRHAHVVNAGDWKSLTVPLIELVFTANTDFCKVFDH